MTSQAKLPFITLKMKPNEYHQLMPTLLDYAKTKGLYDYVVGNETVKTEVHQVQQNLRSRTTSSTDSQCQSSDLFQRLHRRGEQLISSSASQEWRLGQSPPRGDQSLRRYQLTTCSRCAPSISHVNLDVCGWDLLHVHEQIPIPTSQHSYYLWSDRGSSTSWTT